MSLPYQRFIPKLTLALLLLFLLMVLGIYLIIMQSALDNPPMIDDAFIYLRFARNVARGDGIVWNRGESPVEGFTSFLYLMLLALAEKLGLSLIAVMSILGIGSNISVLILGWYLCKFVNPSHNSENLLALILTGLSPTFLYWSISGLEMPLYTASLMASALSYLAYQHHKVPAWLVGCLFAVTALTRPEAIPLFGVTVMFDALSKKFILKKPFDNGIIFMAIAFMTLYVPVFSWKWIYFGYPFPNTYYAKTGGGLVQLLGGIDYLLRSSYYIFPSIAVPLFLLPIGVKRIEWNRQHCLERTYIAFLVISSLGIVAINGGDHWEYGRFIMPAIPFLFILIIAIGYSCLFDNAVDVEIIKPAFLVLPLFITIGYWQFWSFIPPKYTETLPEADQSKLTYFYYSTTGFTVMGKTLKTVASEDETIALVPIGAIGYYSNMKMIDMVGLVDPVIAHEPFDPIYIASWRPGHDKGDGLYVLSRRPDYIQLIQHLTSQPISGLDDYAKQYKSIVEIWASSEFHTLYEFYPIQLQGGWYYNLYRKIDRLRHPTSHLIAN